MLRPFLSIIFCLVLMGCGPKFGDDYELDANTFTAEKFALIEQRTGITIPADSHGINMFYEGSQIDPAFVAKIEIPAASQESLAKQIDQIPIGDVHVSNPLSEKTAWWKPSKAATKSERQFMLNSAYVHVLLCNEDGRWILYLEWASV